MNQVRGLHGPLLCALRNESVTQAKGRGGQTLAVCPAAAL